MKKIKIFIGILFFSVILISMVVVADNLKIRPNGQGVYSEWTNMGCNAGQYEWQCVDENIIDISDNLYANRANRYESFAFEDTGFTNEIINNVTLYFYGQRYNNNRYKFQPLIRLSNTNYLGSMKSLTSSYSYYSESHSTNPATGSVWTVAQVDALEAGMKSYSSNYGGRIAQVYAIVDYSPFIYNSCSDTDGGYVPIIFGNVTGYYNQTYYNYGDYCVSDTQVMEYYCSGTYKYNYYSSCIGNGTTMCSDGRCI